MKPELAADDELDTELGGGRAWWTLFATAAPAVLVLMLFAHPLNPGFVAWFDASIGFQWFAIAGMVTIALTGGYAAAQYRIPEVREFAFALVFGLVYLFDKAAGYLPDPHDAKLIGQWTWWAVPLLVAAWARATLNIAAEVGTREVLVVGRPSLWQRIKPRSPLEWAIWIGAAFFAVVGSWPDLGLSFDTDAPRGWNGYRYEIHAPYYFLFPVFALVVMFVSAVTMDRSWRARPKWISKSRAEYGSATRTAGWVLFGVGALLLASSARIWPEALVAGLISFYVFWFVMRIVSSHHYSDLRHASSLPHRALGGAAVIVIVFAGVYASGLTIVRAAVLGAFIAGAWPLVPTIDRALHGRRRAIHLSRTAHRETVMEASDDPTVSASLMAELPTVPEAPVPVAARPRSLSTGEQNAVVELLVHEDWPEDCVVSKESRPGLAALVLAELEILDGVEHPLRDLVNLRGPYAQSSGIPDEIYVFLDRFPAIQTDAGLPNEELHFQALVEGMIKILWRSVVARKSKGDDGRAPKSRLVEPYPYVLIEVECSNRIESVGDKDGATTGEDPDEDTKRQYKELLQSAKRWRTGANWETAAEIESRKKVAREHGLRGPSDKRSSVATKKQRGRRLDEGGVMLIASWRQALERAAREN